MKTISQLTLFYFLLFISSSSVSQEYVDSLSPVYITAVKTVSEKASPILELNNQLTKKEVTLKESLKSAKTSPEDIIVFSDQTIVIIDKTTYLKVLKKAANKSEDVTSFINEITAQFPVLKETLTSYNNIEDLYIYILEVKPLMEK